MTTNKPEVLGFAWSFRQAREVVAARSTFVNQLRNDGVDLEPLIRLSDYEALQAECEQLRKDAARYQWLKHLAIKGSYDRDWEFPLVDAWEYRPGSEANVEHETLDDAIDAAIQEDNPC